MLIAWALVPLFSFLDWLLRLDPPASIFGFSQKVSSGGDMLVSFLPRHPIIPYQAMFMSATLVVSVMLGLMVITIVRFLLRILLNRG